MDTKKITFPRAYKLTENAAKSLKGYVGLYLMYLDELSIPYPFRESRLIYIGMSESRQYSIGKRLNDHMSGTGNPAVLNYTKTYKASFTVVNFDMVKSFWTKSIEELESYFINDFLNNFGCYPICNNRSSFEQIIPPSNIRLAIDWEFFSV